MLIVSAYRPRASAAAASRQLRHKNRTDDGRGYFKRELVLK